MKHLLLLLFFIPVTLFAQIPEGFTPVKDTTAFKTSLNENSKTITTMESDFRQEKYLSVMSENVITNGHFMFRKSNMLRWEYTDPLKYLIVINKDKMYIKDKGKVSKYDINSNKMFRSINEMMIATVQGNLLNNKEYKARYFQDTKNYLLELTPVSKSTRDYLKVIHLYISKSDYSVEKVKMIEPGGDYTLISFSNRKTNQPISDEKFIVR